MEVENQTRASRDLENRLHQMELQERDLVNKIRDKDRLEEDIERMKQEMVNYSSQSKVDLSKFPPRASLTNLFRILIAKYLKPSHLSMGCRGHINRAKTSLTRK